MIKRLSFIFLLFICASLSASRKPGDFVTSGPAGEKKIALTFDDGPGPNTPKFLDLLAQNKVKATFFVLGEQVRLRPQMAKRIVEEGHEIASHTMTHINYNKRLKYQQSQISDPAKALQAAEADLIADMKKSNEAIEKAAGVRAKLLRMPHGIDRPWIKDAAKKSGFVLVNWTYGADWTGDSQEKLVKSYVGALKPGAIYLFHDGWPKSDKSLAVAEAVIQAALENGYQIVTAGELIGL